MRRILLFAVVVITCGLGCGGSKRVGFGDSSPDRGPGDPGALGSSSGGPGGCGAKCSPDLRSVLDCNDKVVTTCPPDQGCGAGGRCVTPCESASDNKSSIGCDYFAMNPDGWSNIPENTLGSSDGSCYAAFVVNTWPAPASLAVDYKGQTLDISKFAYLPKGTGASLTYAPLPGGKLPPNEIAVLFLAQWGGPAMDKALCPAAVKVALPQDPAVHGTGIGDAFHVTSDVPVVAYDIYPYGGAASYISSATLLLPTSVWGTNYVAVSAFDPIDLPAVPPIFPEQKRPMNISILAQEDATGVTILPKQAVEGGKNVQGGPAGQPRTYTLHRGQYLQLSQVKDLSGSPIQSTKPIALYGGHYCMIIGNAGACDAAHQQIPPIQALGHEYVAVRYRSRSQTEEVVPWRMMGMVDGTVLTYEPSKPPNAPTTVSQGQLVSFESPGPFVIRSQDEQHPFFFAAHMTGGDTITDPNKGGCSTPPCGLGIGDPEFVGLVPPAQFLSSYVFLSDPTYAETNLVIVRGHDDKGQVKDVSLDCAGKLGGWQPVGKYEYTRVDLQHFSQPAGGCDNGRHAITSDAPFGILVWGWDQYVSYAYPAGARVKPINAVVVPPVLR
jgi:hypothetical protein